jgi:hypothetical protein
MAVDQTTQSLLLAEQGSNTTSVVSSATPSVNSDYNGGLHITALAAAITAVTVTGSPIDGQRLVVRLKDNGTTRAVAWGSQFESVSGAALLANTTAGKRHTLVFLYDSTTSKWAAISQAVEA